jgi:tryptophanyl-tRNA synthetase
MSKSLGNAIALCDDRATIAAKLRGARTDSEPTITFEPDRRPQIATLLTLAGLCAGRSPQELAAEVGCGGGGALKELALEAVDGLLAPIRERRAAVSDEDVRRLLKRGVQSATAIADEMLDDVRRVMGMDVVTL